MAILSVTFPFFALVLIGYLAARLRVLPLAAVPGMNTFVLYFALTALLFQLGANTPIAELLDPVVLGLWTVSGLLIMVLAAVTALRRRLGWLDASFGSLIAVLPNSGFMGVPLLTALLGATANGPIIASLLVDIVVIQSLGVAFSHRGAGEQHSAWAELKGALVRMSRNPLPWAIALGGTWGATGLALPEPVDHVITLLAAAATPVALFTIGAVLAREQGNKPPGRIRSGVRAFGDVYWLAALKLLAHPLFVWLLGTAAIAAGLPLRESALTVLVLAAALPAAANVSMLAERFGADNGRVARVILVSTLLSFVTFSAAVALLT
ncbi:MAG: AEC family transporter [Propionibacteriaceae bacterium]|nr:AEC family transporter [Propionibacteriaceae bacterium]